MEKILVIDGTNLIFRNYFVHFYKKTRAGIHTGGLYGTIRSLQSYVKNFEPKQIFICFDKGNNTFRKRMYPEYKAGRKKTEEDLKSQFPMFKEYCKLANIPFIEMDEYEADDIVGSLSCKAKDFNLNALAITGDKDILQLIEKGVSILYLSNNGPIPYGKDNFIDEYGINPNQFIDYKALVGDPSDNIPGVQGVGKKTAAKLLGLYGSLDGLYENTEDLKGKQKENIVSSRDIAYLSKELSIIKCDIDLDYEHFFKKCIEEGFDMNSVDVLSFLEELEITNM